MKYKVLELDGELLNKAVELAGGSIVEWPLIVYREGIATARFVSDPGPVEWRAAIVDGGSYFASVDFYVRGNTPQIAAMRCYVESKFGDTIDL